MIKIILEKIVLGIEGIAIIVAIWGIVIMAINFIKSELKTKDKEAKIKKNTIIKNDLASYVLLAFEILIAADVISSIIKPNIKDLALLSTLVIIRTFISYFLNKELAYFESVENKKNTK